LFWIIGLENQKPQHLNRYFFHHIVEVRGERSAELTWYKAALCRDILLIAIRKMQ